ncbi:MAG: GTPase HflX [Bacteroidetes bacterium]|nr:GTPase HflX [Bacteroidota bacterium]
MIELASIGKEKCLLVGVTLRGRSKGALNESLDELELLADTAGAVVVGRITQNLDRIDPATFIGKGKVEEIAARVAADKIPLVVFDDDLSAVQVRNLEKAFQCKVLDRSALILDIFASRARTSEAKCQVELAQLEYMLPRLTRQWTHLSKQYGGIGTKGPGETQIETDRRLVRTRISHLKERLQRIAQQRAVQRKGRTKHIRAALVGYTNVGKSTLLNLLSGSDVFVENRLFATLDPTTRLVQLSPAVTILMTDTVGFIRKLPHHLVASFKSTLEEVTEADILLHVVDIASPYFTDQIRVVLETLEELHAHDKPTITVFNKIDRLHDRSILGTLQEQYPNTVFISATRGINILGLKEKVLQVLTDEFVEETIVLPQTHQRAIAQLYNCAEVLERTYTDERVTLRVRYAKKEKKIIDLVVHTAS